MAIRKVVKVNKQKYYRGYLFLGYTAELLLECGHTVRRKGSQVCKTAHCHECKNKELRTSN